MAEQEVQPASLLIRSPEGNRRAWLSRGTPPPGREGELGEHIDTGAKLIYFHGTWHRQRNPGTFVVSRKVVAAAGDYAANDVISESATEAAASNWVFRNCARSPGEAFWIVRIGITCTEDSVAFRPALYLFRRPTAGSVLGDNLAMAMAEVDRPHFIAPRIDLPAFSDPGVPSISGDADVRIRVTPDSETPDIFGILQTLDAEANETAGMTIQIELEIVWE